MAEQEAYLPSVLVSPEMCDVLQETADEKGMDRETLMRQHALIMGKLTTEASKD